MAYAIRAAHEVHDRLCYLRLKGKMPAAVALEANDLALKVSDEIIQPLESWECRSVADQIREAIASLDDDPRRKGTRPPRIPWSVQLAGLLTKLEGIAGHTEQESNPPSDER
jgi:hypothetical protein